MDNSSGAFGPTESKEVFVLRAPNGAFVRNGYGGQGGSLGNVRTFYSEEAATNFAQSLANDLVAAGARAEDCDYTVEQYTRTVVISDLRDVTTVYPTGVDAELQERGRE